MASFLSKVRSQTSNPENNPRSPMPVTDGAFGPAKISMPKFGGQKMPRAASVGNTFSSRLGNPTKPLPRNPLGPHKGGLPSLIETSSTKGRGMGKGLGGIKFPS